MKKTIKFRVFILAIFILGLVARVQADTADTLSVSIEVNNWEGGIDLSFGIDSLNALSVFWPEIKDQVAEPVPVAYYDLTGNKTETPTQGTIYIVLFNNGQTRKETVR